MKPWLTGLSEDWVPEPSAPSPPSNVAGSSTPRDANKPSSRPRSRLPRLRSSSVSFSEIPIRPVIRTKSSLNETKTALAERSLSENNILSPSPSDASQLPPSRSASRSFSASSANSVVYHGTVEQKPANGQSKLAASNNTPEWRRRLLKGELGYGERRDLFSPMGLENIFQKPPEGSEEPKPPSRGRGLGLRDQLEVMASSPPPWPGKGNNDEFGEQQSPLPRRARDFSEGERANLLHIASSSVDLPVAEKPSRTASQQLELENENFSPVLLAINHKVGGTINLASLGSNTPNSDEKTTNLAMSRRQQHQSGSEHEIQSEQHEGSSYSKLQEDTLPADLPAGTPDVMEVGGFVSTRRGGYSQDGSFRRRPLSPSPQSKPLPESVERDDSVVRDWRPANLESSPENREDSSASPCDRPSQIPVTPNQNRRPRSASSERVHLSTSPLKLFDTHDTFTSNRLQRRLSQLEYKTSTITRTTKSHVQRRSLEASNAAKKNRLLASVNEEIAEETIAEAEVEHAVPISHTDHSALEVFGHGQFDEYEFPSELSVLDSPSQSEGSTPTNSPSLLVPPPGAQQSSYLHMDKARQPENLRKGRRMGLTRVSNPFTGQARTSQTLQHPIQVESQIESESQMEYTEGKRGPTSPCKDPTPKRRRTLHLLDESSSDDSNLIPAKGSPVTVQSVIGKKRKDARHDQSNNVADPEVLAQRHILRPRNPTPSQRRREEIEAEVMEATEAFIQSSPKLNTIQEQLNSPTTPGAPQERAQATSIANQVAAFNMRRENVKETNRKRSVTTQDFLDEAVKIMEFIRTKGRPTSGLASLEETDAESPDLHAESGLPSSPLTFSRPPSREGHLSVWRQPNNRDLDARVISHLQKFQERDSDSFMASSVRSLHLGALKDPAVSEQGGVSVEQNNIRITDSRLPDVSVLDADGNVHEPHTNKSNQSTNSLARTIATNKSQRSEHVATLAPEAVAHLIPERIGAMSFDREKGIWVKERESSRGNLSAEDFSAVTQSEDDPLGNIPDLTVDEMEELRLQEGSPQRKPAPREPDSPSPQKLEHQDKVRPTTRDGKVIPQADTSSAPSKVSNFAWSFPKTETRATSWSEQETNAGKTRQEVRTDFVDESERDDVEHEIQYYEGRHTTTQKVTSGRARDITVSFSSPHITAGTNAGEQIHRSRGGQQHNQTPVRNTGRNISFSDRPSSSKPSLRKWRTTDATPFRSTHVVPIEEDGELSILEDRPGNYRMQLSMNVSAPVVGPMQPDMLVPHNSTPSRFGDATFMLSDLPDFTLHQVDECELPDRVVVRNSGSSRFRAVEDRYGLGTAELVKALQDVESQELFWEDLRQVDLHDKRLCNVHRLDEFCYRLEQLDVSSNEISQVDGIPPTVRRLNIRDNCLTGLTSWTSLMNLQYLDVSGNEIDSLEGLSGLFHLRTLRVDNNKLTSLHGILDLDGLIELSAEGNKIKSLEFKRANLKSLVELKLRRNELVEVRDLHCLPLLKHLDLDDNDIDQFPTSDVATAPCSGLRTLDLNNNRLSSLNVEPFPALETLSVDSNSLSEIRGLETLVNLRVLSGRSQAVDHGSNSPATGLIKNVEVRSLSISLNSTRFLDISQHLLNLQRLELASMGLKELPEIFGKLVPNVRFLNLNFNALTDLRPLLNIKKLDELLVAGNKISRLRRNVAVVAKLSTLTKIDTRENPVTMRFYAPTVEQRVVSLKNGFANREDADRFILPSGCRDSDEQYLGRLDDETRLRRRVHEMMMASSCANLQVLDGLPFDRQRVLVKDDVWRRLLYLGVVKKAETD